MHVVRVMPIARKSFAEELTFFAKDALEAGMLVAAPVRGRTLPALVIASVPAALEKTSLKREAFTLKKLKTTGARRIFTPATLEAAREAARRLGTTPGVVLAHFAPLSIMTAPRATRVVPVRDTPHETAPDILALQAEREDRVSAYRNLARESFARGTSVMILLPTIPETEYIGRELARGIEGQVVILTTALSTRTAVTAWNRAVEATGPMIVVATPQFLTIPRRFETILVERESARAYIGREAGALDARVMAECLAGAAGSRLIYADFPVRVETKAGLIAHEIEEAARPQVATRGGAIVRLVDVRRKKDEGKKRPYLTLSDYAHGVIGAEIARGGRVAIHAARRGIAPLTVCHDCGAPVTDPATGTVMTLERSTVGNVFVSRRSGAVIPAETPCRICGGWNLVSLGVGVERVETEVRKLFPEAPTFVLTADAAPAHARARKICDQFFDTRGAIIIGTDRMIPYLMPVERIVVTSADAMLAAPAWRADEHTLHTLCTLRGIADEELIIQTRSPDGTVMRALATGNPTEFFERELAERATYGYPPFATFIGLTWTGTEGAVAKIETQVKEILSGTELVGPLPARTIGKGHYQARAVLRLGKGAWPDDALLERLKTLPASVSVSIDPDDIV